MIEYFRKKLRSFFNNKDFAEVLKGSVWALLGRVIGLVCGFLISLILARVYGASVLGKIAVVNSFLGLTTLISILGTKTSILRFIPEHSVKYSLKSAFRVFIKIEKLVIGVSLLIGILTFIEADYIAKKVFSDIDLKFYLQLGSLFILVKSLKELNTQAVRGLKLMKTFSFLQFLPKISNLLALLILGLFPFNENVPVYALFFEFFLTALLGLIFIFNHFKKRIKSFHKVVSVSTKRILSISMPMMMADASYYLMGSAGTIILGIYNSSEEVGFYSLAVSISLLTNFSVKAINSVAASKFSELFHSNKIEDMFYIAKRSAKLIFWTTLPVILFFVFLGRFFISTVYGEDFLGAYIALLIMAFGQFVNASCGATAYLMNMTGLEKKFQNIMLFTVILNIAFNLLLIPEFGVNGAAFSTMISQVFWNLAALIYTQKKFGKNSGYFPLFNNKTKKND